MGGWAAVPEVRQWPDNRSSAERERERWKEGGRAVPLRGAQFPLCTLPEALSHCYRGVQLLCFVVCLYQGQGVDDLSLFVGISGSLMWL